MGNYSFTLQPTSFQLAVSGGVQQAFNGVSLSLGTPYSFNPTALSNGTGAGKAQYATLNGQIQLTAVANPSSAPGTGTATSGGSIAAGTYQIEFTYYNASGETLPSPVATQITTGASSTISVTAPALPAGATGINVYLTAGGSGTGKVGTAASNTLTMTALSPTGGLPSTTLATATIAGQLDLTSILSPGRTFDFSGADHGAGSGGAGGTGGVKLLVIENTDSTPGQIITFQSPTNVWTNGLGSGPKPLNASPAIACFYDATGAIVSSSNKLIQVQAKYNAPILNVVVAGEGSWF